ncbi:hypothetical protein CKK33_17985 [Mucilaginibacter sp. MD40]|uniref:S8 family serine peptidase n=1 Tax=Mucilaginibacter sp. MD40 TaxID=2029590 RepID=UPI000BAC921E|nr:S8 family serine peptidase [Mucilaginibacter sp. MD40]PAW95287.1 hypothetical protein CKK33_17985 [Mucilaginibacter sp. MD40]
MFKKPLTLLFVLLLSGLHFLSFAQQLPVSATGKRELDMLAGQAAQNFTQRHQKALTLAIAKGWVVKRIDKAGNLIALQGVNDRGFPVYLTTHNNTIAAATTGTNAVQPGGSLNLNLSGSSAILNNKLGIWDGGNVYALHREFDGKTIKLNNTGDAIDHATHVSGTMLAKGIYAPAKGMAFGAATLQSWDFDNDVAEMSSAAAGLLLSNHSYGDVGGWDYNAADGRWEWYGLPGDTEDYNFGFYDARTQSWDKIAYNAPYYLIVESAGNSRSSNGPPVGSTYYGYTSRTDPTFINKGPRPATISSNNGYDVITTTGTAKNILTVGSVGPQPNGPVNRQDISTSYFSSWGPTDDGRVKPDIVGDGENIYSTGAQNPSYYLYLSGTSMAAPNITGSLYLLQEYYAQKNSGNFMRAATLKGLACHTAFDAGNVGPDYIYGWGLLDMRKAAQSITDNGVKSIIAENTLNQGQVTTRDIIASGNGPLSVSISWTDPEGTPTTGTTINDRTPKLVNDLDLRISDGSTTYTPWVLSPDNPSAAATNGDNIRDNIEQVYIPNCIPGKKYTITISHKGTLRNGLQAYSLIATGVGGSPYCASAPVSAVDSKITNFTLSNINKNGAPGCTGYTDETDTAIRLEVGKTYPYGLSLGTCGENFNKAAKIFVDWNGDGVFDNTETVATTGVINGPGTFTGNLTVPGNAVPGNTTLLRIVLVETSDAATISPCGNYAKGETQDYRVQFLKPAVDAGAIAILNGTDGVTCDKAVAVTVRLKNFGSASISNIPVKVTVNAPGITPVVFNETYTGTLSPEEETDFTLSSQFNTVTGTTYTVTAVTGLANDPIPSNNSVTDSITVGTPPQSPSATGFYCVNTQAYQLSGTGDGQLFWYTSPTATVPVGAGSTATVTTPPVNNQYYAGLNDFSGKLGLVNKNAAPTGGYNQYTSGVRISTGAAITIESARLYVGTPGRVTFTATNDNGEVVATVRLNVTATRTTSTTAAFPTELPDDPLDKGKRYTLNLLLPAAGNYTITPTFEAGASLYRNRGPVSGYPFGIGDIIKITGNTAVSGQNSADTSYYRNFYYYFYDMEVRSPGCASTQRVAVNVTKPSITQDNDMLKSSSSDGNQWFLNSEAIDGATAATYTPLVSGNYKVQVTLNTGCITESDEFKYALVAKNPDKNSEIGLTLFPVPANDNVNVVFVAKADDLMKLSLVNTSGVVVYQTSRKVTAGNFSININTANQLPGTYVLRVQLGQKQYGHKLIIAH